MPYKYTLAKKYDYLKESLLDIENIFSNNDNSIHKARNELKIIDFGTTKCVVKSFKVPHLLNRIAYSFFRKGKAQKSYTNALLLQELHIETPEPIAIIEFFNASLITNSYFITLLEPYEFTIREVFHHTVSDYKEILKQFTKFTYEINKKGVWHVDYSLGNILISQKDDHYKFSLVDINRMKFREITGYEGLKNFNKFWAKDDEDLILIAKEYARLASLDETKSIKIILEESEKLKAQSNFKKKIKSLF